MAVLCLALVGVLLWLVVVPFFRHRLTTCLIALTPDNRDDGLVPPILFAEEDLQPLSQIPGLMRHDLRGVFDSSRIDALPAQLRQAVPERTDVLIVYATAQGISRDGEAGLLCTDADPGGQSSPAGRGRSVYPVRELLRQLAELDVPLKLLVLDYGNLLSDPRMGMVVNEFPRLLAQAMAEQTDQRLWVLASHSVGQVAAANARQCQSVFGQSVAAGLAGAAEPDDRDGRDHFVSLWELYCHISADCREATGGRQTPLLLRAGVDPTVRRDMAQQLRLVAIRKSEVEQPLEESSADASTVNPPAAARPAAAEPRAEPPAATPASPASESPAPASPAPATQPGAVTPESSAAPSPSVAKDPSSQTSVKGTQGGP